MLKYICGSQRQLLGVSSVFLPGRGEVSNSGHKAWQQGPYSLSHFLALSEYSLDLCKCSSAHLNDQTSLITGSVITGALLSV